METFSALLALCAGNSPVPLCLKIVVKIRHSFAQISQNKQILVDFVPEILLN